MLRLWFNDELLEYFDLPGPPRTLLPHRRPQRSCPFALVALQFVGDPELRAENGRARKRRSIAAV
jgi:hypothetical protein